MQACELNQRPYMSFQFDWLSFFFLLKEFGYFLGSSIIYQGTNRHLSLGRSRKSYIIPTKHLILKSYAYQLHACSNEEEQKMMNMTSRFENVIGQRARYRFDVDVPCEHCAIQGHAMQLNFSYIIRRRIIFSSKVPSHLVLNKILFN